MEEEKVGDPWSVLPIKNKLYAKNLVELHFSERFLTSLINFKDFPNLEVVYLNKNKLKSLDELAPCIRLKKLSVEENLLTEIPVISKFKFIECLNLASNKIRNLDVNIKLLKKLSCLMNLNLSKNPLTEEPGYKKKILSSIPKLEVFDLHLVTDMAVKHITTKSDFELSIPKATSTKPFDHTFDSAFKQIMVRERPNDVKRFPGSDKPK